MMGVADQLREIRRENEARVGELADYVWTEWVGKLSASAKAAIGKRDEEALRELITEGASRVVSGAISSASLTVAAAKVPEEPNE